MRGISLLSTQREGSMNFSCIIAAFAGLFLACAPVYAQESGRVFAVAKAPADPPQADPLSCSSGTFKPACYGIVEFETSDEMYELLVAEGRCKSLAEKGEPCALIYQEKVDGEGRAYNYLPVFKVESKGKIWTIYDGKLTRVSADALYFTTTLIRGATAKYRSFAVVGNGENRENCARGAPCLKSLVEEDMFLAYKKKLPDFVVDRLWSNGVSDPGLKIR